MNNRFLEDIEFVSKINEEIKKAEQRGIDNSLNITKEFIKQQYGDIEQLKQENKQLKEQVIIMEKYLELITDLALDYDGCTTIESLKCLIDELDRLASLGRVCNTTETIYVNDYKAYNILHEEILKGEVNESNN